MSGEKIRILVIDDDVELTRTVCDALDAHGYEAVAANSWPTRSTPISSCSTS
jgi:DNA-binding response OmpR family regulator